MATRQSTIDFLMDQLSSLRSVRSQKLFGEYALYCDEKVVALVCNDQLFVKITSEGRALLGRNYQEGFAYPGAKASMLIGADDLEDHERLCDLIRVTADALPPARPKKPKKSSAPAAKNPATRPKAKHKTTAKRAESMLDHSKLSRSTSGRARPATARSIVSKRPEALEPRNTGASLKRKSAKPTPR